MKQISKLLIRNVFEKIGFDPHEELMKDIFRYLSINKTEGDYYEFGSYRGKSLITAYYFAMKNYLDIEFYAYDSFEGLPHSEGIFIKGQYACDSFSFWNILKKNRVDQSRVNIIEGFYDETLKNRIEGEACIIYIDCDLYSSTKLVLEAILNIIVKGTVIVLEDFYNGNGAVNAFNEWKKKYKIDYEDFRNRGGFYKAVVIR